MGTVAGLKGGRHFQLARFLFSFSFSIQISHSCSSFVATVAHVHGGLCRGQAAALRPLDEVAVRLGRGCQRPLTRCWRKHFLTAPERETAEVCVISCRFCLFCFYAAALTPHPCPPRFQANAGAVGVVGRGRGLFAKVRLPQLGVDSNFLWLCYFVEMRRSRLTHALPFPLLLANTAVAGGAGCWLADHGTPEAGPILHVGYSR